MILKTASLVAATLLGISLVPGTAVAAAAPSVTPTPAYELEDGEIVEFSVAEFAASGKVFVVQCTNPGGDLLCNDDEVVEVSTDAAGAGKGLITLRKNFATVDCGTAPTGCWVVATDGAASALHPITFLPSGR